ncbi:MAG: GTP-binding protein [Burkholderiaceae bacterium]
MRLRKRVRFHVLTGFLGSGKSTLLRSYLHGIPSDVRPRIAILINEFGAVAIDHTLVRCVSPYAQALAGGCACCTVDQALVRALIEILSQAESSDAPEITDIVLETSGLADPSRIIGTIASDIYLVEYLEFANCVTCVEAGIDAHLVERYPEIGNQIACASRIVLTKADVVAPERTLQTKAMLAQMNPLAEVCMSSKFGRNAVGLFDPTAGPRQATALPLSHSSRLRSFQMDLNTQIGWPAFSVWLTALMRCHGDSILRFKGVIPLSSDRALILQSVRHRVSEPEHLRLAAQDQGKGFGLVFICDGDLEQRIRGSLQQFQALVDRGIDVPISSEMIPLKKGRYPGHQVAYGSNSF